MAKNNTIWVIVAIAAFLLWQNGSLGGLGGGNNGGDDNTIPGGCGIIPEFTLIAGDKWGAVGTSTFSASHKFIVDDTASQTYSAAGTDAPYMSTLKILWFNGNETIYNDVTTEVVSKCGPQNFKNLNAVRNTSFTVQCFNEEGNLIDDTSENETVGDGEAVSLDCEIRGVSEKGMPHGGVMVIETPKTQYEEDKTMLSGSIIGGTTSVPSFYTLSSTSNAMKAYEVNPVLGAGVRDFVLSFEATSGQNPGNTNDLVMTLYSKDCYENEETNDFECGIEDEDAAAAGDQVGKETVQVD